MLHCYSISRSSGPQTPGQMYLFFLVVSKRSSKLCRTASRLSGAREGCRHESHKTWRDFHLLASSWKWKLFVHLCGDRRRIMISLNLTKDERVEALRRGVATSLGSGICQ